MTFNWMYLAIATTNRNAGYKNMFYKTSRETVKKGQHKFWGHQCFQLTVHTYFYMMLNEYLVLGVKMYFLEEAFFKLIFPYDHTLCPVVAAIFVG